MSDISIEMAELLAFALELVTYGIFLVFFGVTLWVLVQKSQDGRINKALLATILSLFAISTSHLIIDCVRMVQGFIGGAATPYGARAYFSNLGRPTHVAKVALFMAQTCVGDSFVIYRCFVVWSPSRRWGIIAFPLALLGGTIISGIGVLYATTRETTPGATVFLAVLVPWITSFFALTLCTNIVCTVLIAFRIWRAQRPVRPIVQHSALRPFMVVVIESGAIYSAALLSMLVVYASGSVGQYPALDYIMPLTGIAFSMIIVRVNLGISSTGNPQDGGGKGLDVREPRPNEYSLDLTRIVEHELTRDSHPSNMDGRRPPAEV